MMELRTATSLFLPVVLVGIVLQLYGDMQTQGELEAKPVEGISMLQQQSLIKRGNGEVVELSANEKHRAIAAMIQEAHGHNQSEAAGDPTAMWATDGCTREGDSRPIDHQPTKLPKTSRAAVRCCQHSKGELYCASSKVGCSSSKTYAEAAGICEAKGLRLCTKTELQSNVCCSTGCGFDSKLIWTSTPVVEATVVTEEQIFEKGEDTEDSKPAKSGHLGGFRHAMAKVVSDVLGPLKEEVAGLETKITAIASKKNTKVDATLRELTADLEEVSVAMAQASESRKAANDKVVAAKDAMKDLKASLGKNVGDLVSSEDLKKAEASIKATSEEASKKLSADGSKTSKVVGKNQRYLKQIYKDLHHFPR
jgi:hypothetical protein